MRKRVFLGALVATVLTALSARPVQAQTVYEIREDAAPGGNVFNYLDDLRRAINNGTVTFGPGDEIVLYNNDVSLDEAIEILGSADISVRSATGAPVAIQAPDSDYTLSIGSTKAPTTVPDVHLKNVHIVNNADDSGSGLFYRNAETDRRTVTISNSEFSSLGRALRLEGNVDATLTDTILKDNSGGILTDDLGESLGLTIAFTEDAAYTSRWNNAIVATGGGTTTVTVDVVKGRVFDQRAGLNISGRLNKTGGGVYKVSANSFVTSTDIREGTMHFRPGTWVGDNLSVRSGAVFKVTLDPGTNMTDWLEGKSDTLDGWNASHFALGTFTGENGARMEIGGISKFPVLPHTWHSDTPTNHMRLFVNMISVDPGNPGASFIPESI
ncbi:MAG: hypothetical protein LUG50_07795, partial [Planctomycetaceae bacterium]|nr:hypothetical protein [Planctomycetaceae bacterium]